MPIKLNKEESVFRNELIFAGDAKQVNIDNTLVNLFMLLRHNGIRPKQRARSGDNTIIEVETIKEIFRRLELSDAVSGFRDNPLGTELWIRSNLVNMVYRGNSDKEKISSLRPIHLESYRLRNATSTRDYNNADQVFLMLGAEPAIRDELISFLSEGWDKVTGQINTFDSLDVDSLGLLQLIKNISTGFKTSSTGLNNIKPILEKQAKLFCEDIRKLLVYKRIIPRNVMIDYLKTITSFHLSIYLQNLIQLLPKMITAGTTEVTSQWSIVVDLTDNVDSKVASLAAADAEIMSNSIYDYIKATFQINAALRRLSLNKTNSDHLAKALEILSKRDDQFDLYFNVLWDAIVQNLNDDDRNLLEEIGKYETKHFDKYIEAIMKARTGYLYPYHVQLLDALSQKNTERGILAQGRSRKHPRRFVLGTRLLEALVQILVLRNDGNKYYTTSLSIEELTQELRERYGLIINGNDDSRFANSNVYTKQAFRENLTAFKSKLRQIGFYTELSDAYILQKVRPRYILNA
ncbi:methylation-associated defense system protein MAD7 [Phnomibacter ginsenosidimutans]|uniref:Uncharacterized protein n=1 Tax=Phnomibacter ginsenosidimutans TaxID=2676868 RepID=A0A6I6G5R1_9BACT|nr:hypothetical protein [Phnomibacter ginsenosidimutans]QGW26713.1 hypothetical protein GLV81_00075 [Phnomibacter ginsenosidimutans]